MPAMLGKVILVALACSVPCSADRPGRRGRSDGSSSLLSLGQDEDPYVPNFDAVTKARDSVEQNLGALSQSILGANKKAVESMHTAVSWKEAASKIPELAHQVHDLTQNTVWKPVKDIAPTISKHERMAMSTLLKAVIADLKKQRTIEEPQEEIVLPADNDNGGGDNGGGNDNSIPIPRNAPDRLIPDGGY